jgi:predicted permease
MRWLTRLANLVRRRDLNPEIDEELRFHLDARAADNRAAGMTEAAARRDALRRFGSVASLRERTRDIHVLTHLERLWHDVRHGARVFARHPSMTAIAILSIALGTGANVAIFSFADALLLRPLPISRPSDLITVGSRRKTELVVQSVTSYPDFLDVRSRARSFAGLVAFDYEPVGIAVRPSDPPIVRFATFVTANYFGVLGVPPEAGRDFRPDEDVAGRPADVAILSHSLWLRDFGGDPHVVGRHVTIAGTPFTIVGIADASFTGLHSYVHDSIFVPLTQLPKIVALPRPHAFEERDARILSMKARLAPGLTLAQAQAEMDTISRDLARAYPLTNTDQPLVVQTEIDDRMQRAPLNSMLLLLLTLLSTAVLVVSCANVAGLLASRGPVRAREMALRLAIGANRARLIRQLLTESLFIAVAGGAGGLLVAQIGIGALRQIRFSSEIVSPPIIELDQRTLLFSLAIAMASALIVGLGPAFQTTRVDLTSSLKASDRTGAARQKLTGRSVLVAVQVALSLVILTIALFAVQVFHGELSAGPGFRITHLAKITVDAGQHRHVGDGAVGFFTQTLADTRAIPGVDGATMAASFPFFGFDFAPVAPEGHELEPGEPTPLVWANTIEEHYFDVMGISLIAGRPFAETDAAGTPPVAIVNDTLARRMVPDGSIVGKRLQLLDDRRDLVEIVGVVATAQYGFPGEYPQNAIYFPYRQRPVGRMVMIAHTPALSGALLPPMRAVVTHLDRDVPIFDVQTVEAFYDARATSFGVVLTRLIDGMALMGLGLTMVGLYGLVSYAVARRTREIGIRIAVGATYARILRMMVSEGMRPAWAGIAGGVILSVGMARLIAWLSPMRHQMHWDTFEMVAPIVVCVTLLATFVPARRAANVNPTDALRCE